VKAHDGISGGRPDAGLAEALEQLYERYDDRAWVDPDPLVLLYEFEDVRDREIAGLVASSLAFGGVRQIMRSVEIALAPMAGRPAAFLAAIPRGELAGIYDGFRHRWATGGDLAAVLAGAAAMIEADGSLEAGFLAGLAEDDETVIPALTAFAGRIVCGVDDDGACLLPSPCRRSACKRLNLYLRWMVRRDAVDPGGWHVPAAKLVVPLDRHMHRFGLALGLTGRRQADLRTALEITAAFRRFSPDDPVKYDFAITRLGIRDDDDRAELLRRLGVDGSAGVAGAAARGEG